MITILNTLNNFKLTPVNKLFCAMELFWCLISCLPLALANEAAQQEFTTGNNLFASSVYKELLKNKTGNFIVSPLSAEIVLALTQSGAKDATAEEIRSALHLPQSQETIQAAVKTLNLGKNKTYILNAANKIYIKNDFKVNEDFKKTATEVFDSELENIDFVQTENAVETMNKWVEERTEHKIKNLISPTDIDGLTRLVLINALYFRGKWTKTFKKSATNKQDFYNTREIIQTDIMHESFYVKYYESKELNAKFLELPYEGGDVTMTFVLPNDKDGLSVLENQLEKVVISPNYTNEHVIVDLPKFKFETRIDFIPILKQLGVNEAFKEFAADLSGIAGKKGDLFINKVIQKTFVDVHEEGVEAAASTFVAVNVPYSAPISAPHPKKFTADHPFIFYIKIKELIIFAGRVVDPRF